MSCGINPIKNPIISSIFECALRCNREVAIPPIIIKKIATVPIILMLKWKLNAIKNMSTPDAAIICILALNFKMAKMRQAIVDNKTPIKKK